MRTSVPDFLPFRSLIWACCDAGLAAYTAVTEQYRVVPEEPSFKTSHSGIKSGLGHPVSRQKQTTAETDHLLSAWSQSLVPCVFVQQLHLVASENLDPFCPRRWVAGCTPDFLRQRNKYWRPPARGSSAAELEVKSRTSAVTQLNSTS